MSRKKILLFFSIFLIIYCKASADPSPEKGQPANKPFKRELEIARKQIEQNMLDSAVIRLKKARQLMLPLRDTIGSFNYLQYLNTYHSLLFKKALHEQAKQVAEEMLRVSLKANDRKRIAESHYAIALNQGKLGQWGLAAESITKALKVSEGQKNEREQGKYYFFLSDIFFELRDGKKSLYYSTKAYELLRRSGDSNLLKDKLNITLLEMLSGQHDLALRHLKEAERNVEKLKEPLQTARIYLYLSHVYYRKKEYGFSLRELNKIPVYYGRIEKENPDFRLHAELAMAETHYELKNYQKAAHYFNMNIKHALKVMDASDIKECYQLGSKIYEHLGNNATALDYLKKYTLFSDSVNSISMKKSIHETDIRYQTTLKEKAISDQKLLLINKDYELHKKNRYIVFGFSAIILLVLAVFIAFLVYRNRNQSIELSLLKAQIHPHFLFNTLNNLYALSISKSDQAPGVVLGLANILRYILYECNTTTADLQKELDIISAYIALEKIRYEENLEVNTHIQDDLQGYTIAPLLLLPLVENAYKHGANKLEHDSWINIEAHVKAGKFLFKISNNKPLRINEGDVKSKYGNIGLKNIKKRLEILYPKQHKLKITDSEDIFLVSLEIAIRKSA